MNKSTKNLMNWLETEFSYLCGAPRPNELKMSDFADDDFSYDPFDENDFDSLADENGPSDADIEEMEIQKAIDKAEKK
jgi:hypothetical protein